MTLCAVFVHFECTRAGRMRLNSCVQNPSAVQLALKSRRRFELEATLFWHASNVRAEIGHTESGEREEHHADVITCSCYVATEARNQRIFVQKPTNCSPLCSPNGVAGLRPNRNETDNHFILSGLAEREGFNQATSSKSW